MSIELSSCSVLLCEAYAILFYKLRNQILEAAKKGRVGLVQKLLDGGADIEFKDEVLPSTPI